MMVITIMMTMMVMTMTENENGTSGRLEEREDEVDWRVGSSRWSLSFMIRIIHQTINHWSSINQASTSNQSINLQPSNFVLQGGKQQYGGELSKANQLLEVLHHHHQQRN